MTTTRTELALAACEGLSDTELAERGAGSFKAMIHRKRNYAAAARTLDLAAKQLQARAKKAEAKLKDMEAQLAAVTAKYDELLAGQIEASSTDTNQAAQLLAAISNKQ